MKRICTTAMAAWIGVAALSTSVRTHGFPPAPHHLFYGLVRDEYGHPLNMAHAEVLLESASGTVLRTGISAGTTAGANYALAVPMDSGITSDLYKPTALRPMVPFKMKVKIGAAIYLPIEMSGDYSNLGQPGERTRLNLTLGEDADGDGLPDAWERALLAASNKTVAEIRADEDLDGDGLSNLDEYIAGTYAFDAKDGFSLKVVRLNGDVPVLEFMAIQNRTYTIYGSSDFKTWSMIPFQLSSAGAATGLLQSYQAPDSRMLQVEVVSEQNGSNIQFYKLMVE